MPKQDQLTKRKARVGNKVSHSKRRTKTKNHINLQTKRVVVNGKKMKLRISTKTLKTITRKGIDKVLKKLKVKL
ncbi:50S ribosomal protein L28 [Candidatus Marinamargulisbacteria bacterium SCGC AG-343-D04]|nr:50S ribosomal protein L28 [Candidatus Marinamargulisbacteria bacterium SCGC AG-343-D04]